MNKKEYHEFISASQMIAVAAANHTIFHPNAIAASLVTEMTADIGILEAAGAKYVSATGLRSEGTSGKHDARAALEKLVREIASNAKTIKKTGTPFDNKFIVPKGSLTDQELIETALAFAGNLDAPTVARFGDVAYSSATTANLQTKIDAFKVEHDRQTTGKGGGIAATAETRAASKRLGKNRRLLIKIGDNLLEANGDEGLIAEWKAACHLETPKPNPPPTEPPTT